MVASGHLERHDLNFLIMGVAGSRGAR